MVNWKHKVHQGEAYFCQFFCVACFYTSNTPEQRTKDESIRMFPKKQIQHWLFSRKFDLASTKLIVLFCCRRLLRQFHIMKNLRAESIPFDNMNVFVQSER